VKLFAFCAILCLVTSTRVLAQSDSVITSILMGSIGEKSQTEADPLAIKQPVRAIRLGSASGGFMFGILVGGFAGSQLLYQDCNKCKKPQMDAIIVGGSIGGALGAALGASVLELSSVCSFNSRLTRSLIGAGIGATTMFVAGGGVHRGGRSVFLVPIGAVSGSLGALGRCWKSRE
jgi:hypothetical protein